MRNYYVIYDVKEELFIDGSARQLRLQPLMENNLIIYDLPEIYILIDVLSGNGSGLNDKLVWKERDFITQMGRSNFVAVSIYRRSDQERCLDWLDVIGLGNGL